MYTVADLGTTVARYPVRLTACRFSDIVRLMALLTIPARVNEITTEWLTEALRSGGWTDSATVTSVAVETVGEGQGFMSQVLRLSLEYDVAQRDLPCSVIAKLPSVDPEIKAITSFLGDYQREVRFYEEVASDVGIETPDRYYSATDPETGRGVLLMEDLSHARLGDSLAGCSIAEAQLAARLLAEFQASWWESPQLERLDWMPLKTDDAGLYREIYSHAWSMFVEKAGSGMPDVLIRIAERMEPHVQGIRDRLSEHPRTIVHGDYRLDNLFFDTRDGRPTIVALDWEFCTRGRGTYDLATFISEAFSPEARRREEMDLLRLYHSVLVENGVRGYSYDQCLLDYRYSMLDIFLFWIVVGGYCDFDGERGTQYLHTWLERFSSAIAELDSVELLAG